jgi:tetratricopeptide (TPR) repeat protein
VASGSRWPDRIVIGAVITLMVASPLALGGVRRAAFTNLEALALIAFIAWMAKVWYERPAPVRLRIPRGEFWRLALPVCALGGLLVFQLIPLPARILRVIAPATHRLYRVSFPGWPALSPYQTLAPIWTIPAAAPATAGPAGISDAPSGPSDGHPGADATAARSALRSNRLVAPPIPPLALRWHWQTLSLAPAATVSGGLEGLVMAVLFFLILLYPFGLVGERDAELRFYRAVIVGALATAAVVAALGLLERAWWNGKLLWFYVPKDWGAPRPLIVPRASGPFVDPDHFANFLAMVLPVGVAAAIFPLALFPRGQRANVQLLAGLASLTIAAGLLLSFSRAGWTAAAVGVATALLLGARHAAGFLPARLRSPRRWLALVLPVAFAAGLGAILFVAGPVGRTQIAARLNSAITGANDVRFRPAVWRDTLNMIRDFPLFGVGLGAWPEIFPHYQRAPWMPFFFRAAENDYVQFIAETGVCGALALGWFGAALVSGLRRGGRHLGERHWPLFAGLVGGLVAALIHEGFDFALHTPANALLLTILLALAMRLALGTGLTTAIPQIRIAPRVARAASIWAPLGGLMALGLIVAVYTQDGRAYPYDVLTEGNLRRAEAHLIAHPAMSGAHLTLAQLISPAAPSEIRLALLRAAVWLDPNDPAARDRYAELLLMAGHKTAGLAQVTLSVYHAPRREAHRYLAAPLIPWLLPDEQTAIKDGFEQAIRAGFAGTTAELAEFYRELGRYRDIAELYTRAASAAHDPAARQADLIEAGRNYGLLGDRAAAVKTLRAAAAVAPADPRPYAELARSVFGPAGQLAAANGAIQQGLRAGADPYPLYVALADAAEQAGDRTAAEAALEQALHGRAAFDLAMRLGNLYLADKQFDRAVRILTRATVIDPGSANAWFALGQAHKGAYDYYAAGQDYARAQALAPTSAYFGAAYADFERRTAASTLPVARQPLAGSPR